MKSIERDNSVSMTKGMAIILMVLVHARFSSLYLDSFISLFHMPLFFFMSGYCFKASYLNDFPLFFKKRVNGAYWPYVKWGMVFLLLHNVFYSLNLYNDSYGYHGTVSGFYQINEFVKRSILIICTMNGVEQLLGGFWFLHSYFFAAIISFLAIGLFRSNLKIVSVGGGIISINKRAYALLWNKDTVLCRG